jgi:hypothetical protein
MNSGETSATPERPYRKYDEDTGFRPRGSTEGTKQTFSHPGKKSLAPDNSFEKSVFEDHPTPWYSKLGLKPAFWKSDIKPPPPENEGKPVPF